MNKEIEYYNRYVLSPKKIIKKEKQNIKNEWENIQKHKFSSKPFYRYSTKLMVSVLGFIMVMYDTYKDIKKDNNDDSIAFLALIAARRRMSKEMKKRDFDLTKDSIRILNLTEYVFNKAMGKDNNNWNSLCNKDKFYWICKVVLDYELIEEGYNYDDTPFLSNITMFILFPLFLREFNNLNWD